MAEVLVAGRELFSGPLGSYLRETLPDSLSVVIGAQVQRYPLDAVVVGAGGLAVLRIRETTPYVGEAAPAAHGGRHGLFGRPAPGTVDLARDAERATKALAAFLADEYPYLHPQIAYLRVAPPCDGASWTVEEPAAMSGQNLAESLIDGQAQPDPALANEDLREGLAVALRDRQLTLRQRAEHPFVFRSGGLLGNLAQAWTIRDVVRHMDRHPEDGVYHLRDGTLEEWLRAEGNLQLADLAHAAVRQGGSDLRVALETFLIGSGVVRRPKVVVRPRRVDLGYILPGETASATLRLQRGLGRGYLSGTLTPREPCVDVEPRSFAGSPAHFVVRANTAALRLGPTPYQTELLLDSSASATPMPIAVRFRVVAQPSAVNRYVIRPLAMALFGGLLGAALGAALSWRFGSVPAGLPSLGLISTQWWAICIGLAWSLLGFIRALRQPAAWPVTYTAGRWLGWLLVWGLLLPALALAIDWAWQRSGGVEMPALGAWPSIALLAAAFAALPATFLELLAVQPNVQAPGPQRRRWRAVVVPALVILLVAAVLAGLPALRPALESADAAGLATRTVETSQGALNWLDQATNDVLDRLYLRYYDRRTTGEVAPAIKATPADSPASRP